MKKLKPYQLKKLARKNRRKKMRLENLNNSNRQYALDFFHRGAQYTDNILLAWLACEEMGWPQCQDMLDVRHVLDKFYKTKKNITKRTWKKRPSIDFYKSKSWKTLRYQALLNSSGACDCCGASGGGGVQIHVDHIKPRSKYPELELDLSNLQVLCSDCNQGKDNIDETDWRSHWESL